MLLLALAACLDSSGVNVGIDYIPPPEDHSLDPADTAADPGDDGGDDGADDSDPPPSALPEVRTDDVGMAEWLFGTDEVHLIELTLPDSSVEALTADPYAYAPGDVTVDGEAFSNIGLRIKGKLGSFRPMGGKSSFRIDLDRYVDDQHYHGLKAITVNNMVNDGSFLHELVAYSIYRRLGVAAPRVGYTRLLLNGELMGLYAIIETPDDVWLDRSFKEEDGRLYEADYLLYPDGSYTLIDFRPEVDDYFSLEEGEDIGHADIFAITDLATAAMGTDHFAADLDPVLDWEAFHRNHAIEVWVGQWDGYNYNDNNFKVYFDPGRDNKAQLLPWGHDWAFTEWVDWRYPISVLGYGCSVDPACEDAFRATLDTTIDQIDTLPLTDEIIEARALIEDAMVEDPRKEVSPASVHAAQDELVNWVNRRSGGLRSLYGL